MTSRTGIAGVSQIRGAGMRARRAVQGLSGQERFLDDEGNLLAQTYTDATRPSAGVVGRVIFNTDDNAPNWDDGTNWRLGDGTVT